METAPISLRDKLAKFSDHWSPKTIAALNDYRFKVVKILGDFVWHTHADTDEVFIVIDGSMRIEMRDASVELSAGDLFVVPAGVEHKPFASEECHVLLIERAGTVNTGNAASRLETGGHRTTAEEWI